MFCYEIIVGKKLWCEPLILAIRVWMLMLINYRMLEIQDILALFL